MYAADALNAINELMGLGLVVQFVFKAYFCRAEGMLSHADSITITSMSRSTNSAKAGCATPGMVVALPLLKGARVMINEAFGWFWILVGFISGMVMGLRFAHEDWLGGYQSHARRMLRLGHISFVGLGVLNILFAHTLERIQLESGWIMV